MQVLSPHSRRPLEPRLITFGGGGGGAGRSTIAREFAQSLAQRGRSVLLVDATLQGGFQHIGWPNPVSPASQEQGLDSTHFDLQSAVVPGGRDRPSLFSLPFARRGVAFPPRIRAQQVARTLRSGDWEDILIDLDGRPDGFNATLLALSDYPILVTSSEAPSLSQTVETLRQMLAYALLLQPEADTLERRLLDALESLPAHYGIDALRDAMSHDTLALLLQRVLSAASPWLLLNHTRNSNERDLAQAIALGVGAMTGVRPRVLGALGYDDQRGEYIRRGVLDHPLSGPGDSASLLAQQLAHIEHLIEQQPRLPLDKPQSASDLIGIPNNSSSQETRRAWRHLWDGLRQSSNFTEHVLSADVREQVLQQLEEANQELQRALSSHATPRAHKGQDQAVESTVARQLQQARIEKGITIQHLSRRSHIGLRYLEAIEAFEINALPREVYLRGYLREIARALDLDPDDLTLKYLNELHSARAAMHKP